MHYCVRWAPSCPQKVGHSSAYFLVHVCCGQTAGWIKVSFGMEVDLGPGHTVLDGDPAPPPKSGAQQRLLFGPCLLWTNGWMDQGVTWYGGRPWPWPHCVTWGPSSPAQPPIFGPCPLWLNGCMDQEGATWYGRRSRPRRDCVRCGPSSHSQKGGGSIPLANFLDSSRCRLLWKGASSWPHCVRWGPTSTMHNPQFSARHRRLSVAALL